MTNTITVQQILDNDQSFVQSDYYLITEPGLTHFNREQVISHSELLTALTTIPQECFDVIPHNINS